MAGNITKIKENKYKIRYYKNGVSYSKNVTAKNKTEASKMLSQLILDIDNNKATLKNNITFTELSQTWLNEYLRKNATQTSVENAIYVLNKRILPILGKYKIADITPLIITKFINELKISKTNKGNVLSVGTIKKNFNYISSILNTAYRWELIRENPCNRIKLNLEDNKKETLKFYTLEQAKIFIEELKKEPLVYRLAYSLALDCGLRRSEILALEWNDFDMDNLTLNISKSKQKIKGGTIISKTKTKGSNRKITFPKTILRLLIDYKIESNSDSLFINIHPDTLSHRLISIQNRCKLPHISLHDLRHTNGTLLVANGVDIRTVSGYLGHNNIKTTMIYVHALEEKYNEVANIMNKILE